MPLPLIGPLVGIGVAILRGVSALRAMFFGTRFGSWLAVTAVFYGGAVVMKMAKFVGIALVVSKVAVPAFIDYIAAPLLSLPPTWIAFLSMTKVDQAIGVILAAVAIRAADQIAVKRNKSSWIEA